MSAADDIKDKLREIIMSSQPQIIEVEPSLPVSGEAEDSLRASLLDFFNAMNPPAAVASPFPAATLMCAPVPESVSVFKYGSGDGDDLAGKDANDIESGLLVKSCRPIKGHILMIFSVEDLFRKCMRYTLMKSKIVDFQTKNQGEHLANLIALTEDEWEFFGEDFLYNAVISVYNLLGVYGRDIGVRDMVFNLGTFASKGTVIYAVRIPEGGFFHNYVLKLYENIRLALYYSVLQQWAQWCNDAGEIQANGMKYAISMDTILTFRDIGRPSRNTRPTRYY
jgi:hypothetical protein